MKYIKPNAIVTIKRFVFERTEKPKKPNYVYRNQSKTKDEIRDMQHFRYERVEINTQHRSWFTHMHHMYLILEDCSIDYSIVINIPYIIHRWINHAENQIACGHPTLKDGVC